MANPKLKIDTPRGSLYTQASKSGKVTAILEWNKGFGAEFTEKFSSAQKFVDSEVLRLDAPYMPIDTGMLIRSGELGTVVGGELCCALCRGARCNCSVTQLRPSPWRKVVRAYESRPQSCNSARCRKNSRR